MKKYFSLFILVGFCTAAVGAETTITKRKVANSADSLKGLDCNLEYKPVKQLQFILASDEAGDRLLEEKAKDTLKDLVGNFTIELESSNKKTYRIIILDKDKTELLNLISSWRSVQIVIPVNFTGKDSEDPPKYELLRLTCDPVSLAG